MNKKAVALMSGGLDSMLAVRLIHDMGIELEGVHYTGPFCQCNRGKGGCISFAKEQADKLGISFKTMPLGTAYIDIVKNPKHGYGSAINPCIDCRILMLSSARKLMESIGASFIVTGEVLGQRPMSQLRDRLKIIEKESGLEGLIVRPLCAQHMPETIPEKEGIVDRSQMLAIQGRGRGEQIDLAKMLDAGDYPCPAGGCLLTDKHFASRARDAMSHEGFEIGDIAILKVGRHFRLTDGSKLVVGRNHEENERIVRLTQETCTILTPVDVMGPSAALRPLDASDTDVQLAADIVACYCDGEASVDIHLKHGEDTRTVTAERRVRESYDQHRC